MNWFLFWPEQESENRLRVVGGDSFIISRFSTFSKKSISDEHTSFGPLPLSHSVHVYKLEVSITRVMNYTGTRVFTQDGVKARVIKIPVYTRVFKYPCF